MNVTYVIYRRSTPMGDPIDGAMFNKCDPVRLGISSSVSVENTFFVLIVKNFNKLAQILLKIQVHEHVGLLEYMYMYY